MRWNRVLQLSLFCMLAIGCLLFYAIGIGYSKFARYPGDDAFPKITDSILEQCTSTPRIQYEGSKLEIRGLLLQNETGCDPFCQMILLYEGYSFVEYNVELDTRFGWRAIDLVDKNGRYRFSRSTSSDPRCSEFLDWADSRIGRNTLPRSESNPSEYLCIAKEEDVEFKSKYQMARIERQIRQYEDGTKLNEVGYEITAVDGGDLIAKGTGLMAEKVIRQMVCEKPSQRVFLNAVFSPEKGYVGYAN